MKSYKARIETLSNGYLLHLSTYINGKEELQDYRRLAFNICTQAMTAIENHMETVERQP